MDKKRAPLILLAFGGVAVVVALFLLTQGGSRADRKTADRTAGAADRDVRADVADGGDGLVADETTLKELIAKYGGFTSKGRVLLTLPDAPGVKLEATLHASLDGHAIEAKAETDGEGRFSMRRLPRTSGYSLRIEGARVAPLDVDIVLDEAEEHDFGDLVLDRYYFIKGRVTAAGNRPVARAAVEVIGGAGNTSFSFLRAAMEAGLDEAVLAATSTDADGRYVLRLTKPGVYNLRGRSQGFAPAHALDVIVGARADAVKDLALTRGYEVAGYVLDGAGRPIEKAAVAFYSTQGMRWWGSSKALTRTDVDGRFELRIEPHSRRYSVRVVPPRGVDITQTVQLPLTEDLILRLPGTNALTGRVVDADTQQPVAGAQVLLGVSKPGNSGWTPDYSKPILTDAVGSFRVEGLGAGKVHSLSVRAPGFADVQLSRMFPSDRELWDKMGKVKLGAESETMLPDIPIQRGRVLSGVVRDKRNQAPIPGAVVELWDFVMGSRAVQTDLDGVYRFDGVGERIAMVVTREGYATMREQPWPGFQVPQDRPEVQRDIELDPGGVVRGMVNAASGAPLEGALVRLQAAQTGRGNWTMAISLRELWTYTDDHGRFVIEGVPPVKLRAQAEAPGFDRGTSEDKQVRPAVEVRGLDITLYPGATVSGVVKSRDGMKLSGARITISRDPGKDASMRDQWRALGSGISGFSNDAGEFFIADVPIGDIMIRVEAPGFATLTERKAGVQAGQEIKGMGLEVQPAYTITGRVVNTNGKPVVNCWVRARRAGEESGPMMGARVEGDGTFTVRDLAVGRYTVEVRVSNWNENQPRYDNLTREGVEAGATDLKLVLERAAE